MVAVKAYYDGRAFVPLEKRLFKNQQPAIIVVDEEKPAAEKNLAGELPPGTQILR